MSKTIEELEYEKLQLEIQKIEADKAKADLEIEDLKRGFFRRTNGPALISSISTVVGLLLATYAAWLGFQKLELQDLEGKTIAAEAKANEAKNINEGLQREKNDLDRDLLGLNNSTKSLELLFNLSKGKYETDIKGLNQQKDVLKEQVSRSTAEKQRAIQEKEKEIKEVAKRLKDVNEKLAVAFKQRETDLKEVENLKGQRLNLEGLIGSLKSEKTQLEQEVRSAEMQNTLASLLRQEKKIPGKDNYEALTNIFARNLDKKDSYRAILNNALEENKLRVNDRAVILCLLYDLDRTNSSKVILHKFLKDNLYSSREVNSELIEIADQRFPDGKERMEIFSIISDIIERENLDIFGIQMLSEMTGNWKNKIGWELYRSDQRAFVRIIKFVIKCIFQFAIFGKNERIDFFWSPPKIRFLLKGIEILYYFAPAGFIAVLGELATNSDYAAALFGIFSADIPHRGSEEIKKNKPRIYQNLLFPMLASEEEWRIWVSSHKDLVEFWTKNIDRIESNSERLNRIMEEGIVGN